ncbi:MAG: VanZ family protein [Candidatus Omnitrophota bacterium]
MKFLRFWFPVIIYSVIIFYISSWPNLKVPLDFFWGDKVLHFLEYVPLGYLAARALGRTQRDISAKQIWLLAVLFAFFYGVSDEIHQGFVLGRTAALSDVLADAFGGLLGVWIWFRLSHCRNNGYHSMGT